MLLHTKSQIITCHALSPVVFALLNHISSISLFIFNFISPQIGVHHRQNFLLPSRKDNSHSLLFCSIILSSRVFCNMVCYLGSNSLTLFTFAQGQPFPHIISFIVTSNANCEGSVGSLGGTGEGSGAGGSVDVGN